MSEDEVGVRVRARQEWGRGESEGESGRSDEVRARTRRETVRERQERGRGKSEGETGVRKNIVGGGREV